MTRAISALSHAHPAQSGAARIPAMRPAGPSGSALVAVDAVAAAGFTRMPPPSRTGRVLASFLAQLIATDQQMAQTRERRRAAPAEAIRAYESGSDATRRALAGVSTARIV